MQLAYADIASYLVMGQTSIDDLVTKLPAGTNVTHVNFRSNILVDEAIPYSEVGGNWQNFIKTHCDFYIFIFKKYTNVLHNLCHGFMSLL